MSELTLLLLNGFELETPGLGIQRPNHYAIAPYKQRYIIENKLLSYFSKCSGHVHKYQTNFLIFLRIAPLLSF